MLQSDKSGLANHAMALFGQQGILYQLLVGRWMDWALLASAALAWIATPILLARGLGINGVSAMIGISFAGLAIGGGLLFMLNHAICRRVMAACFQSRRLPSLKVTIVIGIFLRLIWIVVFPATPSSDGATYIQLAQTLLEGGPYEVAGTRAYWPPGYPFFLMPWLYLIPVKLVVPFSQIVLFVAGAIGCHKLTERLAGQDAARIATLLFALWPNLVTLSATPEKEMLILAFLPWICYGVLLPAVWLKAVSGVLLGFATLTQPSLQLLIPALALAVMVVHGARHFPGAALLIFAAAIVIAPWSIRNHQVFDQFVLISTNSGDNLYRANNPLADGGYTDRGEIDLSSLGELEKDREGKALALDWIIKNPINFGQLMVEKQLRFMGDDATGVYNTLKRGNGSNNGLLYAVLKLLSNLWWLFAWAGLGALAWGRVSRPEPLRLLIWCWLYLFALHSIFESAGKYHVPMLWVLCILLGRMLASVPQNKPGQFIR